MTSNDMVEQLYQTRLVVILRGVPTSEVVAIAQALYDTGVRFIEIPFTADNATECISLLTKTMTQPDVYIGGGTILTCAQLDECLSAGGQYAVAPNTNEIVINYAHQCKCPFIPGFWSASEAIVAVESGCRILKFFPAHAASAAYIRSIGTVLPSPTTIMATGSLSVTQAKDYLANQCLLGLGSSIYQVGDKPNTAVDRAEPYLKLIQQHYEN